VIFSKRRLWVIIGLVAALLVWKGLTMRRDIPSQEFIPLDRGIAIVTGEEYLWSRLEITLHHGDGSFERKNFNRIGICRFEGLQNQKKYVVEIQRTELKGRVLYKTLRQEVIPIPSAARYFVLVGASIGKAWMLPDLNRRANLGGELAFGTRTVYDFNKSSAIRRLVELPLPISGVIIKECAAYFPRDLEKSKQQLKKWVEDLQAAKIPPILATSVTVTKAHDLNHPGKFQSILDFNDFILEFAKREKVKVLDLEKALRVSADDHHLEERFAQSDGLHLTPNAYEQVLDRLILDFLRK
jgi:hypothetical protein